MLNIQTCPAEATRKTLQAEQKKQEALLERIQQLEAEASQRSSPAVMTPPPQNRMPNTSTPVTPIVPMDSANQQLVALMEKMSTRLEALEGQVSENTPTPKPEKANNMVAPTDPPSDDEESEEEGEAENFITCPDGKTVTRLMYID